MNQGSPGSIENSGATPSVCIIVENAPSPADRRVWQEALALKAVGWGVSIICPKGPGFDLDYEAKDGIEIFRHRSFEASGTIGYLAEYLWACCSEFLLALRVYRRTRFCVLQACNPPDLIFLIGCFFKLVFGTRFIFDHHDPAPELYETRYRKRGLVYWLLRAAERLTFQSADVAIATNETIREIALGRGHRSPEQVFVVRTCPDLKDFHLPPPQPALRCGRDHLLIYLGNMGSQDGLDLLLESIDYLVNQQGRLDTTFALIGSGPELQRLRELAFAKGLGPYVKFTGPLYGDALKAYLATADVGVAPDPYNVFNDQLTMLKIMEYMASGIPTVLYDLTEGRRSAGEAALYAKPNDRAHFAQQINQLLDSPELRERLGAIGKQRVRTCLDWNVEKLTLIKAYDVAAGHEKTTRSSPAPAWQSEGFDPFVRTKANIPIVQADASPALAVLNTSGRVKP